MGLHAVSGSEGTLLQIYDATLAADAASFDVQNIVGGKYLRLILQARSARAAQTEDPLRMRFNNDSGANYDTQYGQYWGDDEIGAGTFTWAIQQLFAQTDFVNLGSLPAASSPSDSASQVVIDIANYAGTTFNKTFTCQASVPLTDSAAGMRLWHSSGEWRSTAAVNRITIYAANANLVTGSRLTLYVFN